MSNKLTAVILGDIHFPWENGLLLQKSIDIISALRPDLVVQIGDLADQYSFSRHNPSKNLITPKEEMKKFRGKAEAMWDKIYRASPRSKRIQVLGNHDMRWNKRIHEKASEFESFIPFEETYKFDGVETMDSDNQEFIYKNVCFMHGFRSKLGDHARFNQMNTVVGHTHVGGVVYHRNISGVYWELNAGFLGNIDAEVFHYRNQKRLHTWTNGLGIIRDGQPAFHYF